MIKLGMRIEVDLFLETSGSPATFQPCTPKVDTLRFFYVDQRELHYMELYITHIIKKPRYKQLHSGIITKLWTSISGLTEKTTLPYEGFSVTYRHTLSDVSLSFSRLAFLRGYQ